MVYGDYRDNEPLSEIVRAVATGEVDVAAVWGPVAGYFARQEDPPLVVTPIASTSGPLRMMFDIAMGVRKADKKLRAEVQDALSALSPQVTAILSSYGVPLVEESEANP